MKASLYICFILIWIGYIHSKPSSLFCPSGQFAVRNQCVACHPTCAECTGPELYECTKCGIDKDGEERFLQEGRCRLRCPRGYYADRGLFACQPCVPECELCADGSTCARCRENFTAVSGGCLRVLCTSGQRQDPETGECVDCDTGCSMCSTDEPEVCHTCSRGYVLYRQRCRRACPRGTFEDVARRLCLSCPAPCLDCWSETLCLTCQSGYFLNKGACVKHCPDKTFGDTSVWRCQACHVSCQMCHGPGAQDCDQCEDGHFPLYGQCPHSSCPQGHYYNGVDGECLPCHVSCLTCFGPTALDCSTCQTGYILDPEGSCVGSCPTGFFANTDAQLCEECSPSCEACERAGDMCTSCKPDAHGVFLHQGKCWSNCPDGFFEALEGKCEACDGSCLTCDRQADHCLSCKEGLYLENGRCGSSCSPKSFPSSDGACGHCPAHCEACEDSRTCSRCSFLYLLLDGICKASCPEGYFEDMDQGLCVPCHTSCAECSGPKADDCVSCAELFPRLHQGTCSEDCPLGTYHQAGARECQECDNTCSVCSGPKDTQCSQCQPGLVMDSNTMRCRLTKGSSCPPRTFLQQDTLSCLACHSLCESCVGAAASQCQSCAMPRYLHNSSCVKECPADHFRSSKASDSVELGFCTKCDPMCATCTGPSAKDCLSCSPGYLQLVNLCISHCPTGFYARGKSCAACDSSCQACSGSGPGACLGCTPGLLDVSGAGRCVEHCARGFFQQGRTCRLCHPSCLTCTDPSPQGCLSCHWGNKLEDGMCSPQCEEQHYLSESEHCEPCDPSCQRCSGPGPDQCLTCPPGHALHSTHSRCVSCCNAGTNSSDCCPCVTPSAVCAGHSRATADEGGTDGSRQSKATWQKSAVLTAALILVLGLGLVLLLVIHVRSSKWPCWNHNYERLSGTAWERPRHGNMPRGTPLLGDVRDEAEVVYASRDGTLYCRYNFFQDPDSEREEDLIQNASTASNIQTC